MNVLITGAAGQLGQTLQALLANAPVTLEAHDIDTLDLTDAAAVNAKFAAFKPQVVINTAAYTAVDKAEQEAELADLINHQIVDSLAQQCAKQGSRLIHISTDFVFDGSQSTPYEPQDSCQPLSVYGCTKYAAEQAISKQLPHDSLIIRTAWLYSAHGNNFVKTMLRLMTEKSELNIIYDQIGTPTAAHSLAELIKRALSQPAAQGIYHWSDAGVASWYDFAVAIFEDAYDLGLLNKPVQINPIPGSAYPTPATRPSYSVMDKTKTYADFSMPKTHWRAELRQVLSQLAVQGV